MNLSGATLNFFDLVEGWEWPDFSYEGTDGTCFSLCGQPGVCCD